MPKPKFVDFRAVKAAVSMEQILRRYGLLDSLKGSGETRRGACPIHRGTNQSQFSVNLAKGVWNCFSDCKCGGNHLEFVAKMENTDIHRAALTVCEWFDLDPADFGGESSPTPERSSERPRSVEPVSLPSATPPPKKVASRKLEPDGPNKPLGFALKDLDPTHPYLAERGLTPETIAEFGLGFFPAPTGLMVGRIALPIHNAAGQLIGYAGRWPGEPSTDTPKYKLPTGFKKRLELYNLHRAIAATEPQPWLLVEGFFDCLHLWQHGARRVVALMGSSLSPEQQALLIEHTNPNTHVIVLLDEDEAGREARGDIAARLSFHRYVRIHRLGDEGRQPEHLTAAEIADLIGGGA